jgi:hypothetical protein
MSNAQIKSIALSALRLTGVILMFAAKAIVYLCIAIAVVGQLLFAEYAQTAPAPIEESSPIAESMVYASMPWLEKEPVEDAWEEPIAPVAPVAPVATMAQTIARPDAVLVVEIPEAEMEALAIACDIRNYQAMSAIELRKECGAQGVKWRNAHGKSKHLSKAEMLEALGA